MPWSPSPGKIDKSTQAISTIEYEHHEIHDGKSFYVGKSSADLDDEGDNDAIHISFVTPDSVKEPHMIIMYGSSGKATFVMREAPDGGVTGGTAMAVYNKNRNSVNTSILVGTHSGATAGCVTVDASIGTNGTVLMEDDLGSGKNKQPGQSRGQLEWILKRNTEYSMRVLSSTADIMANLILEWYEHSPKP